MRTLLSASGEIWLKGSGRQTRQDDARGKGSWDRGSGDGGEEKGYGLCSGVGGRTSKVG